MARLPTQYDLGQLPRPRGRGPIPNPDASAIGRGAAALGRGISQFGAGISGAADKRQAQVDKNDAYDNDNARLQFMADMRRNRDEMVANAPPGALGIESQFTQFYADSVRQFQEKTDPKFHRENDGFFLRNEMSLAAPVRTHEVNEGNRYYGEEFIGNLNELREQANESGDFKTYMEEAERLHANSPATEQYKAATFPDIKQDIARQEAIHIRRTQGEAAFDEYIGWEPGKGVIKNPGASQLIRNREGFRSTAYWDVNHYRVGYGADIVVRSDGKVEAVTENTVATEADAERTLQYIIDKREGERARKQVGDAWRGLSKGAQAALYSVAYNYGSLPDNVASAARAGDEEAIARAIEARSGDNNGINSERRHNEAAIARGGSIRSSGNWVAPKGRGRHLTQEGREDLLYKVSRETDAERKQQVADEASSLLNTGSGLGILDFSDLNDSDLETLDYAKFRHDVSQEIANATNGELRGIQERLVPEGEGFANEQKRLAFANDAIRARTDKQHDDPAGYEVEQRTPAGAAYTEAMESQDPQAVQSAILGLRAEQARKGLTPDMIRSVPKTMAGDISNRIKDADNVDTAFANFMQQKEFYGDTFAGVTENMDPGWADVDYLVDAGSIQLAKSLTRLIHNDGKSSLYGPAAEVGMMLFKAPKANLPFEADKVALSIFDGRFRQEDIGKPKGKSEDTDENIDQTVSRVVGDAFDNASPVFAAVRDAALAYYANTGAAGDEFNSEKLEDAIQKVTGGILEHNGDDGTGKFVAPLPGVTNLMFKNMLSSLKTEDIPGVTIGEKFPHPVTAEMIRNELQFVSIGNGVYELRYGAVGPIAKDSKTGEDFELNLIDLMAALAIRLKKPYSEMKDSPEGRTGQFGKRHKVNRPDPDKLLATEQ